jgi:hypothetical protein
VFIANEYLDDCIQSRKISVLCKLDLKKAYDPVSWDFLIYLLQRCCFGEKWQAWIECCISTVRFSILVYGTPARFLNNSSRGIQQRDLLSPLLFVVVMEALSRMLTTTMEQGLLTEFSVGLRDNEALLVSHFTIRLRHKFLRCAV